MGAYTKIQRTILRVAAVVSSIAVVAFAVLVLVRIAAHTTTAEAASIIYYPNFCLGGWKYPQHASGPAAVTGTTFDGTSFTADNSAYLESSTASQIFCGYFSVKNAKNPPKKAVISFNWNFAFPDGGVSATSTDTSFTSQEGFVSIPAAGVNVPVASTTASSTFPMNTPVGSLPASPQNDPAKSAAQNTETAPATISPATVPPTNPSTPDGGTTEIPLIPNTAAASDAIPSTDSGKSDGSTSVTNPPPAPASTPPSESSNAPAPVSDPTPPPPTPAPAPAPTPSSDAPQSFNIHPDSSTGISRSISAFVASLIAEQVRAAEPTEPDTIVQSPLSAEAFKDFLEVSYSLDGIRWTAIGRVNKENWKGYKVEIPVTSWDEVKRLQIMVSVLPTIDQKPDIYLDSMSMRAEYNQTVAELAAQGLAAMSNAVDALIGDGNDPTDAYDIVPDAPKAPQGTEIRTKKLRFTAPGTARTILHETYDSEGKVSGKIPSKRVSVTSSTESPSLVVSGECAKKYFVVITYRNEDDYLRKPRSFVVNQAHECNGGTFTFDFATLSTETNPGPQYLVIGEQGEEGTWNVVSDVFPITIEASTTVETVYH